jgi:hypothetical protein
MLGADAVPPTVIPVPADTERTPALFTIGTVAVPPTVIPVPAVIDSTPVVAEVGRKLAMILPSAPKIEPTDIFYLV